MTKREYVGIGHREKFVTLHRGYSEKKHTDVEWYRTTRRAEARYHQLSQDFGTARKPYLKSIQQLLCNHNWGKAPAFPEGTHFEFCYKCSKAHYRDERTEEQLEAQKVKDEQRQSELRKYIEADNIKELRQEELKLESRLIQLRMDIEEKEFDYQIKWGEKA